MPLAPLAPSAPPLPAGEPRWRRGAAVVAVLLDLAVVGLARRAVRRR